MAFLPPHFPPNICRVREFLREKNARGDKRPEKRSFGVPPSPPILSLKPLMRLTKFFP